MRWLKKLAPWSIWSVLRWRRRAWKRCLMKQSELFSVLLSRTKQNVNVQCCKEAAANHTTSNKQTKSTTKAIATTFFKEDFFIWNFLPWVFKLLNYSKKKYFNLIFRLFKIKNDQVKKNLRWILLIVCKIWNILKKLYSVWINNNKK